MIYCISISHKTTPILIRERFSFSKTEQIDFLQKICAHSNIYGGVILSTCNRSEIYFSAEQDAVALAERMVSDFKRISIYEMKRHTNIYRKEGAVKHLFCVTCGLDSMVLGEDEILRQVKEAYQLSLEHNFTNTELNIVFQGALNGSKTVKTDTNLSKMPVSIGTLAANETLQFLQEKNANSVLIVGITGKIGSIIAKNLSAKENIYITGTSRKHNRIEEMNGYENIKVIDYQQRYNYIHQPDVIISATTSPHYTFTYYETSQAVADFEKERLFIDLAVPCDIDKEIRTIKGAKILDIDYFETAARENNKLKIQELDKAEFILDSKVEDVIKNLYFQEFCKDKEKIFEQIEKKGLDYMMYHLKNNLSSKELKAVFEGLNNILEGEK